MNKKLFISTSIYVDILIISTNCIMHYKHNNFSKNDFDTLDLL